MFLAYVSTADKLDLVDIKVSHCIVVALLTKLAISFFSLYGREPFDLPRHFSKKIPQF